jgi:hypothetical protein
MVLASISPRCGTWKPVSWRRTVTCRISDGLIVHASYFEGHQDLADRVFSDRRPETLAARSDFVTGRRANHSAAGIPS